MATAIAHAGGQFAARAANGRHLLLYFEAPNPRVAGASHSSVARYRRLTLPRVVILLA